MEEYIVLLIVSVLCLLGYLFTKHTKGSNTVVGFEKFNPKFKNNKGDTMSTIKLFPLKEKGDRKAEADEDGNVEFTVRCKMKERWAPYFLAMLKRMQWNGQAGHSAILAFYDDGDGDFRPNFKSDVDYPYPITKTSYNWKDDETGEIHKGIDIINTLNDIDELFDAG